MDLLTQSAKAAATGWGFEWTNLGEFRVLRALHEAGVKPDDIAQQFQLGPYRLDFAFVAARICIEADGWVHGTRMVANDRKRDRLLKEWGWFTQRIDVDAASDEAIESIVQWAVKENRKYHTRTTYPEPVTPPAES